VAGGVTDSDRVRALGLGTLATLLYLCTAPAVPNADGLGYLKLLPHNFAPGHLLYMPALRGLTHLLGGDGLSAGRLLNAVLGGTGVVLTYGLVRRALGALPLGRPFSAEDIRFAASFAAAGLGLSFGYWIQGADVEAYAGAMVALLATVRLLVAYAARPTLWRALAVGALLGISVMCHLTHVVLTPFVFAYLFAHAPSRRDSWLHATLAVALGGLSTIGGYAYAALYVRKHDLAGAIIWISSAQHGFVQSNGIYRLADAIYGLAKSIIFSPYLHESDAPRLLGQFLLGLAPLIALGALYVSRRRALPPVEWRLGLLWIAPYAMLGVLFFGSDSERWLFILPALWLLAATLVAERPHRVREALLVLAYLGVLNFATGLWPQHADSAIRGHAESAARPLHDGDLIVFPGHSWDEYVSFFTGAKVTPFPIAYYAARDGVEAGWQRLEKEVSDAHARGGKVYALRVFDEHDEDPRGFEELASLGLDHAALREHLRTRATVVPLPGDGAPVVRLDWQSTP